MPIIQSLDRALRILDLFDETDNELKITDISKRMGLHKSTVHSLLKTLQEHRYIEQDEESGKYRLGMKLLERAHLVLQRLDIRTIARKLLQELTAKTGQTTHLVIPDGHEGVYIDKVEGARAAIRYSQIGRRIPLHSSGVGKALVAFRSPEETERLLEGYDFFRQTAHTITDKERFLEEIERIRRQGYAIDNQENEPGVRCVAMPVRNHKGAVVAAVSISTLVSSVGDAELEDLIVQLRQTTDELSAKMGYGLIAR
ncbi:IclR family transcriptional regulator [Paenibacillus cymbidii]|uniref:IclR family transcriptional regulator n=1 Tax=Paenibacillus cymbidii TaxID=1639034 RepID=UPI0010805ABB|nr:IclR family transcriptional regulator [Paenibacillus cymbidii]